MMSGRGTINNPRTHNRPHSFNQNVYSQLWMVPFVFLLTTVLYLQYTPPMTSTGVPKSPSSLSLNTHKIDLNAIGEMIRKEIREYISSSEDVTSPDIDSILAPKVYPPVKVLSDSNMMRIIVTGGSGFVGSHLVDRLLGQGHQVTVLDNFFTGRARNLAQWAGHPNFQLITHDITEPIKLEADQIYHLACPASPPHYQYNPIKTIKTNTQGTLNMLGLAKRVGARMLLASTSEIYGDPEIHPQREDYWGNVNPIGPRACYDEGKRVAETMMYAYQGQSNVDVRVARIFNTFGPRMHPNDGRVVSNFVIQALQGKDLTIYGEGQQTRSFQYVDDLVSGLVALMNGNYSQPVNLGNPEEFTVKGFASLIIELTGSNSTIRNLPRTEDDPKQRKPDISLAEREIGWKPMVPVRAGLAHTIKYFQSELDRNDNKIDSTGPFATKPQPVKKTP